MLRSPEMRHEALVHAGRRCIAWLPLIRQNVFVYDRAEGERGGAGNPVFSFGGMRPDDAGNTGNYCKTNIYLIHLTLQLKSYT